MLPNVLPHSASDHTPVLADEVRDLLAGTDGGALMPLYAATGLFKSVPVPVVTKYAACNVYLRASAATTAAPTRETVTRCIAFAAELVVVIRCTPIDCRLTVGPPIRPGRS